ncbi:DUF7551 domain-containing protein [Halopiger aswanensis]|uniref:Uncharacterized protein n=1 Tax=Halopiger aswanensis TaxID=148449 RepID=A0A419WDS8_9EURY|nr:hypothetical protein [Halopiger aswanensis]RKD93641.1 hypothetical protein ATJ93_3272 [Halopiger aswanensis]
MVGTTLREIRERIEQLASDGGEYYIVCGRSGERPVPVAGKRFPSREAAVDAVKATEQYRAALRRYDPQLPFYDPVVCQEGQGSAADPAPPAPSAAEPVAGRSRSTDATGGGRQPLIGFCHDVSGAVFEALSARDHAAAESAIMDTYLAAAEAVTDPDALCLVLLESMATELERHLTPSERVGVLEAAARALSPVQAAVAEDPVEASLEHLHSLSLISEYGVVRRPLDADGGNAWVVYLRGYAMESSERRFPTLPIGIDLLRRTVDEEGSVKAGADAGRCAPLGVSEASALGDDDWRLVLTTDAAADGLICVEEGSES